MKDKNLKELIQELTNDPAAEHYGKPCEVVDVDETARTCDVMPYDGTAMIYGVRLQAIESSAKGVVLIPKKGAGVLIVFISKSRAFVAICEEVDKVLIDCEEVVFNGGANGGTYNALKANIELNKLKARMTALEASIATFGTAQNSAALAVAILVPLAAAPATLAASVGALPPTGTFGAALIDDKIKH
jgi:hypothetical protein